jgi:dTDP-4-amino-4,6-dideoxygalactose transaminase
MTALSWDRDRGHAAGYDVSAAGFNYRLDEARAAIGLVQLARLPEANAARARAAERYQVRLEDLPGIGLPLARIPPGCASAHHLAVVVLPPGTDRAELRRALAQRGIQTSVHYPPIHTFSAYRELAARPLPRTDALAPRLLTLPLFPHMTEAQVDQVAGALSAALAAQTAAREPEEARS